MACRFRRDQVLDEVMKSKSKRNNEEHRRKERRKKTKG